MVTRSRRSVPASDPDLRCLECGVTFESAQAFGAVWVDSGSGERRRRQVCVACWQLYVAARAVRERARDAVDAARDHSPYGQARREIEAESGIQMPDWYRQGRSDLHEAHYLRMVELTRIVIASEPGTQAERARVLLGAPGDPLPPPRPGSLARTLHGSWLRDVPPGEGENPADDDDDGGEHEMEEEVG